MSSASPSFPPGAGDDCFDQFQVSIDPAKAPPELWTGAHDAVQSELARLEAAVLRKLPTARAYAGRTTGREFFLFSYRTFSVPEAAIDPVVAGVTIKPAPHGIAIEADVSGEHLGDSISSIDRSATVNSANGVLDAAKRLAEEIGGSTKSIAAALRDASRRID